MFRRGVTRGTTSTFCVRRAAPAYKPSLYPSTFGASSFLAIPKLSETTFRFASQQECSPCLAHACDSYAYRHIGPNAADTAEMLKTVGFNSLEEMMTDIIPADIRRPEMDPVAPVTETEALAEFRQLMGRNKVLKSLIGQGYCEAVTPNVIVRHILESPRWYTPYTPYQAEISQGRLESLLNFQTMITELSAMDYSNACLLDEATAAFEAVNLAVSQHRKKRRTVYVAKTCLTSTIEMIRTRAAVIGINVVVGDLKDFDLSNKDAAAVLVQTPDVTGQIHDFTELFAKAHQSGVICLCSADLLAATLLKAPGEMGADVVFGTTQRFGIPLGYGGPHAAYFTVKDSLKRLMPGRLIGVSKDATGKPAYRMTLQTREQHIKREKATSNVCTAQALLANMAAMYGVYHGPQGLKFIAQTIHTRAKMLSIGFASAGHTVLNEKFFDTVSVTLKGDAAAKPARAFSKACVENGINIHVVDDTTISITVDEATSEKHIVTLLEAAGLQNPVLESLRSVACSSVVIDSALHRTSSFMKQEVFNKYHCETEMMRYIEFLVSKDYGLTHGMVPLGSCTMKLNAATTLLPLSWPEVTNLHPHAPEDQVAGYQALFVMLKSRLRAATGLAACTLQPNSGAQGEYAGLRVIQSYHESRGEGHRNVCIIPINAHGTNPASAVLSGLTLVTVKCLPDGRIDFDDFNAKCTQHSKNLSCVMITYPSTYGFFDANVKRITEKVHEHGGQVYIDGANLNAMIGYTGPGFVGGDVCHINLHKTLAIPHGGGGPGMGPICVREHLTPFLPNSTFGPNDGGSKSFGQVSQAPFGSASVLHISYLMMQMLGTEGLKRSTEFAVLSANYLMERLKGHYSELYKGDTGRCAHEFIIDIRPFAKTAGIEAEDVAKRLMDYGFHAPTLAFPVAGTLMIEPTESENKAELDRLADALISIRQEIREIEEGKYPKDNNVLVNSPHPVHVIAADEWDKPYSRSKAGFPTEHQRRNKFWPSVARIDGAYGDRNLHCTCTY